MADTMRHRVSIFLLFAAALFFFSCNFMEPEISPEEELVRNLERIVRETPVKGKVGAKTKKAVVTRFRPGNDAAIPEGAGDTRREKN